MKRFWDKVDKSGDCWEWTAHTCHGYGYFRPGGTKPNVRAHRLSWQLTNGEIPEGMLVCHHCDNRKCVRPSHLFLGTQAENLADASKKGRLPGNKTRGPNRKAKKRLLSDSDHIQIKESRKAGVTLKVLAERYSVSIFAIQLAEKRNVI